MMFYTGNKDCYNFQTAELDQDYAIPVACEADTRAYYHAHCIGKLQSDAIIVYDFEDTDVWMVSAYLSHQSQQQSYMYKSRVAQQPLYYISKTLFDSMQSASAALGLYVFTGVDTVEAFLGCGKVGVWNRLLKQSDISMMTVMQELGCDSSLSDDVIEQLARFTVKVVYSDPVSRNLAESRAHKWRKSITGNSAKLPPDFDSFHHHCLRAHLQVRCVLAPNSNIQITIIIN
jgi:hypothetical protein